MSPITINHYIQYDTYMGKHYSLRAIEEYNLYFFKDKDLLTMIKESLKDERLRKWALRKKNGIYINFPKIYFFITFLSEHHGSSSRKVTSNDFIGVTAKFLKDKFKTKNYKDPINVLKQIGIIEANDKFSQGSKELNVLPFPKSYRLKRPYSDAELILVQEGKMLRTKERKKRQGHCNSNQSTNGVESGTKTRKKAKESQKTDSLLTPDTKYLQACLAELSFDSKAFNADDIDFEDHKAKAYAERAAKNLSVSEDYCFPDPRISKSLWSGRLTTDVTGLKKELRPFFRKDGASLVSIDVHASQPFLLMGFYRQIQACQSDIESERHQYANLFKGDFYSNIGSQILSEQSNRRTWKTAVINHFLFPKKPKGPGKLVAKLFESNFPLLAERIEHIKSNQILVDEYFLAKRERQPKEKNYHRQAATMLQKFEADIIIDEVCGAAFKEKKYVVTIHDELMVEKNDVEFFKDQLIRAFRKTTAYAPILKLKHFDKNGRVINEEVFDSAFLADFASWSSKIGNPDDLHTDSVCE